MPSVSGCGVTFISALFTRIHHVFEMEKRQVRCATLVLCHDLSDTTYDITRAHFYIADLMLGKCLWVRSSEIRTF